MDETSTWFIIRDTIKNAWFGFIWWLMPGVVIRVPHREGEVVVPYGHPLWYDVGATQVIAYTDDPIYHYGPWLRKNVGRQYLDWQMQRHTDFYWGSLDTNKLTYTTSHIEKYVLIKIRKEQWANVASLMWA